MRHVIRWPHPAPVVMLATAILLGGLAATARPAAACMWDYDTLAEERQQMPGVLEAAVGFLRHHSAAYDEWRIADRQQRLERLPADAPSQTRLRLHDDLAVSHDRLGQHERAIEILQRSLAIDDDRYETHANLGTVLIHAGQLDNGLRHLRRAIAINPDAHFGREIVQIAVVLWARRGMSPDGTWQVPPLPEQEQELRDGEIDPAEVRRDLLRSVVLWIEANSDLAVTPSISLGSLDEEALRRGVVGMLRFGRGDSPILLAALGSLVSLPSFTQQIAASAFLRAAEGAKRRGWSAAAEQMRSAARREIGHQHNAEWADFVAAYEANRKQARALQREIAEDEQRWIAAGEPVDERYQQRWLADELPLAFTPVDAADNGFLGLDTPGGERWVTAAMQTAIGVLLIVWLYMRSRRRERARERQKQSRLPYADSVAVVPPSSRDGSV